ncbi:MAG: 4Fe-4S binding protein [Kiritimatiellia bacterium]
MPWINNDTCTQCGICINKCPAEAISMEETGALINDDNCIRCGICHSICPVEAVRHDAEHIPQEVAAKLSWIDKLLHHEYYTARPDLKKGLQERLRRNIKKDIRVLNTVLEHIDKL